MIIAGEFEYYGTTEFYNPRTKSWTYKNRVKEHEWLYGFTTININGVAYMFGGKEFSKEFRLGTKSYFHQSNHLRVVQTQSISLLKSMSERVGSDIERL